MSSSPPTDAVKDDHKKQEEAETQERGTRKRKKSEAETESEHEIDSAAKNDLPNKEGDGKNWKRIMANRKSARESRLRRIKYMETLEKSVEELTKENTQLLRENQAMARENFALRQQVAGISDPSMMDPSSFRPQSLVMGARGSYGAASAGTQGLLNGEGAAGSRLPGAMSPSRTGLSAASRSSLAGMDMTHPSLANVNPLIPPVQDDQFTLEMMRRRRTQAGSSQEEEKLLEIMRGRR